MQSQTVLSIPPDEAENVRLIKMPIDRSFINEKTLPADNELASFVPYFEQRGISSQLLHTSFPADPMPNFKHLFLAVNRLKDVSRTPTFSEPWQLYLLSGELNFINKILTPEFSAQNDTIGWNFLRYAAVSGSPEAINAVIGKYPQLAQCTDKRGFNFLHYAALSGSPEAITTVLGKYPQLAHWKNKEGFNFLHYAALSGSPEAITTVLGKYPQLAQWTSNSGSNFLHYAALSGSAEAIKAFTNQLSRIVFTDPYTQSQTAEHYAALSGPPEAIAALAKRPANLTFSVHDGRTILHYAALSGSPQAIEYVLYLLKKYPYLADSRTSNGLNFLHFVAASGSSACFKWLLMTHPALVGEVWIHEKDIESHYTSTLDKCAERFGMRPKPTDILLELFKNAFPSRQKKEGSFASKKSNKELPLNLPEKDRGDPLNLLLTLMRTWEKSTILAFIKKLPIETQMPVLKQCLDKGTPLGARFWETKGFFSCNLESGTLKKIKQHLTQLEKQNSDIQPAIKSFSLFTIFKSKPAAHETGSASEFHNQL